MEKIRQIKQMPRRTQRGIAVHYREVIKLIKGKGWEHIRSKGGHYVFKHKDKEKLIVVPINTKGAVSKGIIRKIMKKLE